MIDSSVEELRSLAVAARGLPKRRAGRPVHASTLFRWASRGIKGIRLEVLKVGGTTCTSAAALQRFFQRLTEADEKLSAPELPAQKAASQGDDVDRRLDSLGL